MVNAIIGKKLEQSQKFLSDGTRTPVTLVLVSGNVIVMTKNADKDGYSAYQIGFGERKKLGKAIAGHIKKANLEKAPLILREVKTEETTLNPGDRIRVTEVFEPGDTVNVTGVSKGKGFAGVVKRHHFRGGPRTHGQSDRERAPGSIGQTTTPGRVFKGKRMAGRMGAENVTIQNLTVLSVTEDTLLLSGLVPGGVNSPLVIKKVGHDKKFTPLFEDKEEEISEESENSENQNIGDSDDQKKKEVQDLSSDSASNLSEEGPVISAEKTQGEQKAELGSSKADQETTNTEPEKLDGEDKKIEKEEGKEEDAK